MIRYALRCRNGHLFESWFRSAAAYDSLRAAGHVSCPDCGLAEVEKAPMAPQLRPARSANDPAAQPAPNAAEVARRRRAEALSALRREVEATSDYVGLRFATEARRMHTGEMPERAIHGEARPEEARALIEDGVPIAPLPFIPTRKAN